MRTLTATKTTKTRTATKSVARELLQSFARLEKAMDAVVDAYERDHDPELSELYEHLTRDGIRGLVEMSHGHALGYAPAGC